MIIAPQKYARIAGWLYLFIIVAGIYAELFVRDTLVVSGDAAATAKNIAASAFSFRFSVALEDLWLVCAVIVALLLYALLRPVHNDIALLATFLNLVSIAVEAIATVGLFAALFFYEGASYLNGFTPDQLHTLGYLSLKGYDYGFGVSLVFFGCCLISYGYLVFTSGYFPKTIGVLLTIAGLSYLINSFTLFVAPALANAIFPVLVLAFIGESSFCLWLIVKGIDVQAWSPSLERHHEG